MASRNKILKQVDRLAQRGNHAEAASTLLKLVEESPRDVNLLNRVGDLYVRAGLIGEAVKQFNAIAAFFKEDGFLLKAIAIYKKVSKLEPSRIETFLQLGELYAERGLRMEARQNLMRAAEGFTSRGNSRDARRALEILEKLDPDDPAVQNKLVDMAEEGGDTGEAVSRHLDAARKLIVGGKRNEGLKSLEKALERQTGDPELAAGMADILLQTGDAVRAAGVLERVLPSLEEPGLDFLLLLGRAKRESGDLEGARAHLGEALKLDYGNDRCHVEMALCYLAGADGERAFEQCRHVFNRPAAMKSTALCRQFLDLFLEKEPLHLHALRELAILHRDAGDDEAYRLALSRLAGACHQAGLFREELQVLSLLMKWATGDVAQVLENRRAEAEQLAVNQAGSLDESLIDFLPHEDEAPSPVDDSAGDASAIDLQFDEAGAGEANGSDRVLLGAEEESAPDADAEIELIIEDDPFPEAPELPGESAAVEPAEAEEEAVPLEVDSDIRERLTATRVFLSYGMLSKALGQVEELLDRFPGRSDVCELAANIFQAQGREKEAEEMRARLAELFPAAAGTPPPAASETARASWMNGSAASALPVPEEAETAGPAEPPAAEPPFEPPPAVDDGGETALDPLSEELEEIDFFLSQGFTSEARDLIQGLLAANPGHPRLLELLEQVGGAEESTAPAVPPAAEMLPAAPVPAPPAAVTKPPAAAVHGEEPKLTGTRLDDEQLSEVFSMFQREVAGQVDDEDFGTHYDLGIAYKEMSLVDEAIGEFQIAARSSERRLDCCAMLGACFMEKGMPGEAMKWYEKGLAVVEVGSEESKGLQYDMAAALEADGAADKALEAYLALAAVDGQYRDLAARIKRLQSA
jgi:tetratricopeptide (TPR) repeat protein